MYGRWWLAIGYLLLAGACVATTGFAPEIKWFGAIGFAILVVALGATGLDQTGEETVSFEQRYTWKEGEIPKSWVRQARRALHENKVTSKLRKKGTDYFLVLTAPDKNMLEFARHVFQTTITRARGMGVSS